MPSPVYERRRPETTLYHVVQENLDTLYGAVEDGALAIALPKFVRKELEGYLECGLLCHGFARLKCPAPERSATLDVLATDGELFLVMDYVMGESLARLARTMVDTGLPSKTCARRREAALRPHPSCSGSATSLQASNRLGKGARAPCKCTAPRSPDIRQLVKSGLIRLRSLGLGAFALLFAAFNFSGLIRALKDT